MIRQGEVYWIDLGTPRGSEPGFRRPFIVAQNNLMNRSRIHTILCCAVTTNMRRVRAPGNVLLERGEGSLSERSVANVSQIFAIDRELFGEPIGQLDRFKLEEVLAGIQFVIEPRDLGPE